MKTICPHCKQEFPEIPEEYLGMTLECPVCKNEFVCEKPKFCSECGASSLPKALKCAQCGKFFPAMPQQPVSSPQQDIKPKDFMSYYAPNSCRISSANNLSFWDTAGINWCVFAGVLTPLLCLLAFITGNFILAWCLLPVGIICCHGAILLNAVKKPHKKIYWTPYRKFVLTASCVSFILLGIGICLNAVFNKELKDLVTLPIALCGICGSIKGWKLFNKRAEEDIDYEESEEDISEERLNVFLSLANGCGLGTLLPFGGILFLLLSGIFLAIYIRKGGTDYWKAVILSIVGIAVQAVTFYCTFFA